MRTSAPHQDVWLTRSSDGGKTWSEPARLTEGKVHPADLPQLPDDRVLLFTRERRNPFGVPGNFGGADEVSVSGALLIAVPATRADCGYPSSAVVKDDRILTVYYAVGDKAHPEWGTHCGAAIYDVPK